MAFRRFDPAQLPELMGWFGDARALHVWGGPDFRFPFDAASFREDAKVDSLPSFALLDDDGSLAAFGQCYLRVGRCHFGRVGVAPRARGRGLGTRLLRGMAGWGGAEFGPRELSLFVDRGNADARRLYLRLGFRDADYPEAMPAGMDAHYMVAPRLAAAAAPGDAAPLPLEDVRRMAMALHGSTESPHHRYTSFRVRGRIYATAPAEGGSLRVFVDEAERERMTRLAPAAYAKLGGGRRAAGLAVDLGRARPEDVAALLRAAWQRKRGGRA